MSEGKWTGGAANRQWIRPGSRIRARPEDAERDHALFERMKHERFLCDGCGMMHPLIEHRDCREQESARPNIIATARERLSAAAPPR